MKTIKNLTSENASINNVSGKISTFINGRFENLMASNIYVENVVTNSDIINIKDYGAGIGNDDAVILRSLVKSNRTVFIPNGIYYFKSAINVNDLNMTWYCVDINGVSNFAIIGEKNTRIIISNEVPNLTNGNYGVFLYRNSLDKFNAGLFCEYNRISSLNIIFTPVYDQYNENNACVGINITSASFCEIDRCIFDCKTNNCYRSKILTGIGGFGHDIHNNIFLQCTGCFEHSNYYNCVFRENKCLCSNSYGNVSNLGNVWLGGLNCFHSFYDNANISNIRISNTLPYGISAFNTYVNNIIQGYKCAFLIKGIRWSIYNRNKIFSVNLNENNETNIILVSTDNIEISNGYKTGGIDINHNIIYNCYNLQSANMRGIFIDRSINPVDGCIINFNTISNNEPNKLTFGIGETGTSDSQIFGNIVLNGTTSNEQINRSVVNILTPSATGADPQISTSSGDLFLNPSGTSVVRFGTYTNTPVTINGYIEIKDKDGNIRKLATST